MSEGSIKARLLAWSDDQRELDEGLANLLHRLCQFADAECCAWAAVATLADLLRKSERTIQYRLRDLEAGGYIRPTGRVHRLAGTTRSVPIYQLAPGVEGLDPAAKAASMGAKSAPIDGYGCNPDGGMGATACTRIEPRNSTSERSNDLSPDAGAREQASPPSRYDLAVAAWPATGRKRTNFADAPVRWAEAAAEVGEARLVAAVMAAVADPDLHKGDHGWPGLHRWLREERYRAHLPAVGPGARGAGAVTPATFAGPPELRVAFVAAHGEPAAVSYLDRCGWSDGTLLAATGAAADWLRRNASAWLKAHGLAVERAGSQVGERV